MLAAFVVTAQAQTYSNIASYTPPTNVVEHNEIDLDQADIETHLKAKEYGQAAEIYSSGKNSAKSSGMRSIKGMSKDLSGEVLFEEFKAYYGEATFPDSWVTGALGGSEAGSGNSPSTGEKVTSANGHVADFATVTDDATREQAIKKGTVQMIIWPYAIHELESAQGKCGTDETKALHYLDEFVAFYVGSMVGADGTGATKGKLMWGLGQSRCKDFVTCGSGTTGATSGVAKSNAKVMKLADEFKAAIKVGTGATGCDLLKGLTKQITDAGYTQIIQGALKYGFVVGEGGASAKYKAEAATFGMAIAPRVNTCSPADAKIIYDNMKIGAASLDWAAVKAALERNYQCMGVTCADIGAYTKDGVAKYEACTDGGSGAVIGGIVGGVVGGVLIIGLILKFTVFKGAGAAAKAGSSTGAGV